MGDEAAVIEKEQVEPEAGAEEVAGDGTDIGREDAGGEDPEGAESEIDDDGSGTIEERYARLKDRFGKRVGKLTARAKSAEERLAAAESELQAFRGQDVANLPLPASYLKPDERALIKAADVAEERVKFLLRHRDGVVNEKDPSKGMTADEVAEELATVQAQAIRLTAKADGVYERGKQKMLRHLELGRKAEAELAAAARKKATVTRGPGSDSPAASTRIVEAPTSESFKKLGGNRDAAVKVLRNLVPE